ncbi:MAG: nucleotide pyrophosphatase/phosphodiesterase family protein [bacterium]
MPEKILLVQVAACGYNFLMHNTGGRELYHHLAVKPIQALFPALTCVVQASLRTAALPRSHGIVGNGFFFREEWKPLFWEQSSRLIQGPRIWEGFRSRGGKVALMFIQQSLGPDSDLFLSPAPVHKHHGGMILDCISEPPELNHRLRQALGRVFPLHHYWGPLASKKSSQWITRALMAVMEGESPDFLYAYLPHLDYALQKYGPTAQESRKAFHELDSLLGSLLPAARKGKYRVILFGDYPILEARGVVFPNKALRKAGFFKTRDIGGRLYPNYHTSAAFGIADHQIAHIQLFEPGKLQEVRDVLEKLPGVDKVLDRTAMAEVGLDHPRSGELVLVASPGYWFDYRWWDERKEAPDFAGHVDIHNKPGYDPCELFWGWPPPSISQNPSRIKGTHGRVDHHEPVFYATDLELPHEPGSIIELAESIRELLDSR